jgi:DNA-binding transcriptional MerR regulator
MNKELSIQQVATITGLGIHTLRYYERLGLLASTRIRRLPNGHRRYSEVDLEWIEFVKCLRETAMPIAEMQHFAEITRQGESTVKEQRELHFQRPCSFAVRAETFTSLHSLKRQDSC